MMYGRLLRVRFDKLKPDNIITKSPDKLSKNGRSDKFMVGEQVYVRNYRLPNKKNFIKSTIVKVLGPRTYLCKLIGTEQIWKRHLNQINKTHQVSEEREHNTEDIGVENPDRHYTCSNINGNLCEPRTANPNPVTDAEVPTASNISCSRPRRNIKKPFRLDL